MEEYDTFVQTTFNQLNKIILTEIAPSCPFKIIYIYTKYQIPDAQEHYKNKEELSCGIKKITQDFSSLLNGLPQNDFPEYLKSFKFGITKIRGSDYFVLHTGTV